MNPAWSVIVFTTAAGMGQGLVVTLALVQLLGAELPTGTLRWALAVALALLLIGLGSSFLHLGRPERAWRAMAMWRTSWLSREVIVLPAYIGAVSLTWWLAAAAPPWWWASLIVASLLLWWCTAMIYACLRFIQEWAHPYTATGFVLIGLSSGAVLAGALAVLTGDAAMARALAPWALSMTLAAWLARFAALQRNASLKPRSTLQSATGIQAPQLRQIAMGMTGGSFNTREFFHRAGAATLPRVRWVFQALLFALPIAALTGAMATDLSAGWIVALISQLPGLLAERWLFFAQARHPQNLYYQVVS